MGENGSSRRAGSMFPSVAAFLARRRQSSRYGRKERWKEGESSRRSRGRRDTGRWGVNLFHPSISDPTASISVKPASIFPK